MMLTGVRGYGYPYIGMHAGAIPERRPRWEISPHVAAKHHP
jgi:hypothetical protein